MLCEKQKKMNGFYLCKFKSIQKKMTLHVSKTHINLRMYIKHIKAVTCLGVEYDNKKKSV